MPRNSIVVQQTILINVDGDVQRLITLENRWTVFMSANGERNVS